MAKMNFDYIAGFLDGEGSITIASAKYYFHPRVSISQNTKHVLEEIQIFLAKHNIKSTIYREIHKPRGNSWYNLRLQDRKSLAKLCNFLNGKLFVKAEQLFVLSKFLQIEAVMQREQILKKETIILPYLTIAVKKLCF